VVPISIVNVKINRLSKGKIDDCLTGCYERGRLAISKHYSKGNLINMKEEF
jgi:hypothetical protein